jgi:DNA-binding SARP family transcriptional activator
VIASSWNIGVLGPLEVRRDGRPVDPGPYKQRVLLGALLLRPNAIVRVEELLHAVWGEEQPRTARKNLQVYVSALRRVVGDRISHRSYGYRLDVLPEELDLLRFDRLAAEGRDARRAAEAERARAAFGQAARLWRDRALADLGENPYLAAESTRLAARRLDAYENWFELEIETGHHLAVLEELSEFAALHPLRERLTAALMTALERSGARNEALACYEARRQLLARELGLDPSPVLQRLYRAILTGITAPSPTQPSTPIPPRRRVPAAQLPRDLPDFVGRAAQIKELTRALSANGGADVAVITGPVASGKTALAVRVSHLLSGHFPDGQVFVALADDEGAARPRRDVLVELMRGIGLTPTADAATSALLAQWRSCLAERRFLFVLDDALDEHCVRELLPAAGPSRTLVTSTRVLCGLESVHRLTLGDLEPAECMELLERLLGADRMRTADEAVRQITARCGASPVVLRAVAAKLALLRHITPHEFADRIHHQPEPLDELEGPGFSVRDRLTRLHTGLSPLQQAALRRLGALPEPQCAESDLVAALADLFASPSRAVEALLDVHLLTLAEPEPAEEFEVMAHAAPAILYTVPPTAHRFATLLHADEVESGSGSGSESPP